MQLPELRGRTASGLVCEPATCAGTLTRHSLASLAQTRKCHLHSLTYGAAGQVATHLRPKIRKCNALPWSGHWGGLFNCTSASSLQSQPRWQPATVWSHPFPAGQALL